MVSSSSYLILLFNLKIIFPNIEIKNVNIGWFFFFSFGLVKWRRKNSWKIKSEILFKV